MQNKLKFFMHMMTVSLTFVMHASADDGSPSCVGTKCFYNINYDWPEDSAKTPENLLQKCQDAGFDRPLPTNDEENTAMLTLCRASMIGIVPCHGGAANDWCDVKNPTGDKVTYFNWGAGEGTSPREVTSGFNTDGDGALEWFDAGRMDGNAGRSTCCQTVDTAIGNPPPKEDLSGGPFIFRDDPDQRAICNQIATEDACNDDRLCSWNVFHGKCNDHGYQPIFKGCDTCRYVRPLVIPFTFTDDGMHLGSCPDPYQQDGWQMVFEVEDGDGDDVPNDWNSVLNGLGTGGGFKTDTAYFWGVNNLNAIDYTQIQICGGYRASTDGCPRVKCYNIDSSMLGDFPDHVNNAGFTNPLSKVIACFAGADCSTTFLTTNHGEWRFPIGYADDPAPMETYGEAETGELVWSCVDGDNDVFGGQAYHLPAGWHFQGYGWQGFWSNTGTDELSMHAVRCNSAQADDGLLDYMNLVQIRVKTA